MFRLVRWRALSTHCCRVRIEAQVYICTSLVASILTSYDYTSSWSMVFVIQLPWNDLAGAISPVVFVHHSCRLWTDFSSHQITEITDPYKTVAPPPTSLRESEATFRSKPALPYLFFLTLQLGDIN